MFSISVSAVDARARRAAKRIGLRAIKSRRNDPLHNHGKFMLINDCGIAHLGFKYDASAEDVIQFCRGLREENKLRHTAIHEAGHALAHIRLRILQTTATIVRDKDRLGAVHAEDSVWNAQEAAEQVLSLCSGYGALRACGYDDRDARLGADEDFEEAERLIEFWALESLEDWLKKAVEFHSTPKNRKAIGLLADGLLKYKTLSASFMDCLVDYSDGEMSESEWKQYREVILPRMGRTPSTA
jgi:hypothetical protein